MKLTHAVYIDTYYDIVSDDYSKSLKATPSSIQQAIGSLHTDGLIDVNLNNFSLSDYQNSVKVLGILLETSEIPD